MVARTTWWSWYTGRAVPGFRGNLNAVRSNTVASSSVSTSTFRFRPFRRFCLFGGFFHSVSEGKRFSVLDGLRNKPSGTNSSLHFVRSRRFVRDRMQMSRTGSFHVCINFVCARFSTPPERAKSSVPCRFCVVHNNNGKHAPSTRSNNRRMPILGDVDGIEKTRFEWNQVSLLNHAAPPMSSRRQRNERSATTGSLVSVDETWSRAKIFFEFLKYRTQTYHKSNVVRLKPVERHQ